MGVRVRSFNAGELRRESGMAGIEAGDSRLFFVVGRWSLQCKPLFADLTSMGVLLRRDFLACRVRNFRGVIFLL